MRRRRSSADKGELEVIDNPVHHGTVGDEAGPHTVRTLGEIHNVEERDTYQIPDNLEHFSNWPSRPSPGLGLSDTPPQR